MSDTKKASTTLVQQDEALDLYMDSLLGDLEPTAELEEEHHSLIDKQLNSADEQTIKQSNSIDTETAEKNLQSQIEEAPKVDLRLFLPKVPSPQELELIEQKKKIQLAQELELKLSEKEKENQRLRQQLEASLKKLDAYAKTHTEVYAPDWAQPSFQVLLFDVGHLKLAIPVNDLDSIVIWDEKYITPMPGSEKWYLGLIQHLGKSIPVIDTLMQVVPPERIAGFMEKRKPFKHVIFIGGDQWGLVCEDIIGIKTLEPEAVKWRSKRTTRRWLLGTVKEYMCALLDTQEFATMLKTGKGSFFEKKNKEKEKTGSVERSNSGKHPANRK